MKITMTTKFFKETGDSQIEFTIKGKSSKVVKLIKEMQPKDIFADVDLNKMVGDVSKAVANIKLGRGATSDD